MDIKGKVGEINKNGEVLSTSVKIKLKPHYPIPENITLNQFALIAASHLLKHPLQIQLEEEEFYIGGFSWIEFNKDYNEFSLVENRPYRKAYQEQFLPAFRKLHQNICKL